MTAGNAATEYLGVAAKTCFHCGLPVPSAGGCRVQIDGAQRWMCCPGCEAVAKAIVAGGYQDYYRHRTHNAFNPADLLPEGVDDLSAYDHPATQQTLVRAEPHGLCETSLILEGITCAACSWLNERCLRDLTGVVDAQVNYSTHRARVRWDPGRVQLSQIVGAVKRIGYAAHPYDPERYEAVIERQRKALLRRLGVSAALGMQVMMLAVAMYFARPDEMFGAQRTLFHWVSLLLTLPIVVYAAYPFFRRSWHEMGRLRPGMDTPVSLGIALAFGGSAWSAWQGSGAVYFESVAMFTFFLLTARYLELAARQRSMRRFDAMAGGTPNLAHRLCGDGSVDTVAATELKAGDRVRVLAGAQVPADGVVTGSSSSVSESLLTGESRPLSKHAGDRVLAGSVNLEHPIELKVTATRKESLLSQIVRLVERAQSEKPRLTRLADRVASAFVLCVLLLASAVGLYWWHQDPERWLEITVSVLVVTCPCALSLAMPTALTAATNAVMEFGAVVTGRDTFERLAGIDYAVFDKTGTLTEGEIRLIDVHRLSNMPRQEVLSIAAALEAFSQHPISRAVTRAAKDIPVVPATDVATTAGGGITGTVHGRRYHLGQARYLAQKTALQVPAVETGTSTVAFLGDGHRLHAALLFSDRLRSDAVETIRALKRSGVRIALYSGDRSGAVNATADALGIDERKWDLTPEQKLTEIRRLQAQGFAVAMIGDGVNDAPVLSAANVSAAMGGGADLARTQADLVLVGNRLRSFFRAHALAEHTMSVIRQNLFWAVVYNLLALPAAAAGMVPPWLAAVGMSASSLLVVGNATRLLERDRDRKATQAYRMKAYSAAT